MQEPIKILCVDDEQNVLNSLKRLFLDEDYTILTATSGQDGLEILKQEHVHIVMSDYRMPGMNGVEFLKEVCAMSPDTVRIVLSGYADTASIVSAINDGQIYKFIPKPWNDDQLKVTISTAIERYFLFKKNMELTAELKEKNDELLRLNTELKRVLKQKCLSLEFSNEALSAYQYIIDSVPVGIIGIDPNYMIVMCNATWSHLNDNVPCMLGQDIREKFSADLVPFIDLVKKEQNATKKLLVNGHYGRLSGRLMEHGDRQKGIILTFIEEGAIS